MKGSYGTSTQLHGRKDLRAGMPGAPGRKAWPNLVRKIKAENKAERAAEQALKEQRAEAMRLTRKPLPGYIETRKLTTSVPGCGPDE